MATPLELEQGWWRCAIVYIGGGISGALGASVLQPTLYMVGSSAGVYALLVSQVANVIVVSFHFANSSFLAFSSIIANIKQYSSHV